LSYTALFCARSRRAKTRMILRATWDANSRTCGRASGQSKPGQTVIEAISGNTGIGLAMVCAQNGYPLVITMDETLSVERRKLMRFLGAKVVLTPAAQRGMGMVIKAFELAKARGWFLTRQFENEANPDIHSRTTGTNLWRRRYRCINSMHWRDRPPHRMSATRQVVQVHFL
jgi:cysteine synthase